MTLKREEADPDDDEADPNGHPDYETPILTEKGPMKLEDALADPDAFVRGMSCEKTYATFVAIPPLTLRTLLRDVDGSEGAKVEPYVFGGKSGSLVTTPDEDLFVRIQDRFPPVL